MVRVRLATMKGFQYILVTLMCATSANGSLWRGPPTTDGQRGRRRTHGYDSVRGVRR